MHDILTVLAVVLGSHAGLGSENYEERNAASSHLESLGKTGKLLCWRLAWHPDPEVTRRAERICPEATVARDIIVSLPRLVSILNECRSIMNSRVSEDVGKILKRSKRCGVLLSEFHMPLKPILDAMASETLGEPSELSQPDFVDGYAAGVFGTWWTRHRRLGVGTPVVPEN